MRPSLTPKQAQTSTTLIALLGASTKLKGMQISDEAKLKLMLCLMGLQRELFRYKGLGRKRTTAIRHRVNRLLNVADNTLTDEIFACFEGR